MRVTLCIDALQHQLGGIGRYTWELCTRLPAHDEITNVTFYGRRSIVHDPALFRRAPRPKWFWRQLWRATSPMAHRVLRSTIVHGPNYFLPPRAESGVITVHDLSVFRYPETHPPGRVATFEALFASSIARASRIITDTETVRQELIEEHSVAADAVSVVPLGVPDEFRPRSEAQLVETLSRWGLRPAHYGLSVAAFEPRKKIGELIAAWRRLPQHERNAFPLVLAGVSGWRNEELQVAIAQGAAEGWLINLGFVDEADLPLLYAGARLFVYPSIYEGFGLPPVEAMASGVPVIVSNRSCLPEVCGPAARYIDPDDDVGFTRTIEECLHDTRWQNATIERGLERAGSFTWDSCVAGTIAAYRQVDTRRSS